MGVTDLVVKREPERLEHRTLAGELSAVHKKIDRLSCFGNFSRGWRSIMDQSSRCTEVAYKILAIVGTGFAAVFGGGSFIFAGLAMKQAFSDLRTNRYEGRASIIGHWAEWSNQAMFVLSVPVSFASEVASIGKRTSVELLYQSSVEGADDPDLQAGVYESYLDAVRSLHPSDAVFEKPFPITPNTILLRVGSNDLLYRDFHLRELYKEIAAELNDCSTWTHFKTGCGVIHTLHGTGRTVAIMSASMVMAAFILGNTVTYGFGIVWSALQAKSDAEAGLNPSIGGHCLEWSAEVFTVLQLSLSYLGEITRVGRSKRVVNLFMSKSEQAMDDDNLSRGEKRERLESALRWILSQVPKGSFYNLPSSELYPASDKSLVSVDVSDEKGGWILEEIE